MSCCSNQGSCSIIRAVPPDKASQTLESKQKKRYPFLKVFRVIAIPNKVS